MKTGRQFQRRRPQRSGWPVQYVGSMGFTPRRIRGLPCALAGGVLVPSILFWASHRNGGGFLASRSPLTEMTRLGLTKTLFGPMIGLPPEL